MKYLAPELRGNLTVATNFSSAEAEALGLRLARSSAIITVAPALVQKDFGDLAKEDPTLSPQERARLFRIGDEEGKLGIERVAVAIGAAYAKYLPVTDLRVLVRQAESPQAVRRRAAEPLVMMHAMKALGSMDFKKATAARMCKEIKKLCGRR